MSTHDIHQHDFGEETKEKLDIYAKYLEEFLRVFLNTRIRKIQVFDFFAGPGKDPSGVLGSPLRSLQSVDIALAGKHVNPAPEIRLYFNEWNEGKIRRLEACFSDEEPRPGVRIETACQDFAESFEAQYPSMSGCANLIFLDQYGVKQITRSVFERIAKLPTTDVIFFVSSAMVHRFRSLPEIRNCLPVADEDFRNMNSTNVHRIVSSAYRRWIPDGTRYFIGSFSIKKQANVYGLVFGSGHPKGMDKFLRIAWKHGGDANFDIDEDHVDPNAPHLFPEMDKRKKVYLFQEELQRQVLSKEITTNKKAFIFSLECGCLASQAKEKLQEMVGDGILPMQSFAISYDAWASGVERPIKLHEV
jgi:three-Cys-motif partner protein